MFLEAVNNGIFSLLGENLAEFFKFTGFANVTFGHIIMILIGLVFITLAIKKDWEPMLLVPIGFGIIIIEEALAQAAAAGDELFSSGGLQETAYNAAACQNNIAALRAKAGNFFALLQIGQT